MATFETKTFTCPACGQSFDKEVQTGFNMERDGKSVDALFAKDYFFHTCPHCGKVFDFEHDFLLYDPETELMIQFLALAPYEAKVDPFDEIDALVDQKHQEFLEMQKKKLLPESVQYRTTFFMDEVIEKITIFTLGFDDRIMEVAKAAVFILYKNQHPKTKIEFLRFSLEDFSDEQEDDTLCFLGFDDNEELVEAFKFIPEFYDEYEAVSHLLIDDHIIDESWAVAMLDRIYTELAPKTKKPTKRRGRKKTQ